MNRLRWIWTGLAIAVCAAAARPIDASAPDLPAPVSREVDFLDDVDPILAARCYPCHGTDLVMNGYSMWEKDDAIRGGYSGKAAIQPGDSENSRLIRLVAGFEEGLEMPPAGGRLSDEEIAVLRAWIDQGVGWEPSREDSARLESNEWLDMDYGSVVSAAITVREPTEPRDDKTAEDNVAYKAHAVSLTPDDRAGVVFDTELLRYAVGWTGGFLNLTGTVFDWKHGPHPWVDGEPVFETPVQPGWARGGSFADPRPDGFGNLPEDWGEYRGYYVHGNEVVFSYSVGGVGVLDLPSFQSRDGLDLVTRTLETGPGAKEMCLQVAQAPGAPRLLDLASLEPADGPANATLVEAGPLLVGLVGGEAAWELGDGQIRLRLPPSDTSRTWRLLFASAADPEGLASVVREATSPASLRRLTRGGPSRFPETVTTRGRLGTEPGPYVVDEMTLPFENPWRSWMRPGDFAFFDGEDRAVVTTWSGDVWTVDGVDEDLDELVWRRYATGFHQPQGAEVVDGAVYVLDRNQVTRLHDLNGDGEADFHENFNNDFKVTHHFHEFTFDLDRDRDGNFYFAKAARHALPAKVEHHGVIMKLDPRGETLEVVCRGFRVPNGVAVGPGGEITTSDQEGHWIPSTPIVMCEPGGYYGYAWGGGVAPARAETDYDRPITYIPISVDNSGAGQAWVPDDRWGPFEGHLVHASFGRGKLFLVLMERVEGVLQGGVVLLPVDFDTGLLRPDFRKKDGHLYVSGLYGWGTRKKAAGGFYRVRYQGGPVHMPTAFQVSGDQIAITFTDPLDRGSVESLDNYVLRRWNYRRSSRYGSDMFRLDGEQGTEEVTVRDARLSPDGRTITLEVENLREVDQMQMSLTLEAADGSAVVREVSHTINRLASEPGEPVLARGVGSKDSGPGGLR